MNRLKALRVPIYPSADQAAALASCCQLVDNLGLEQRSSFWRQHRRATGRAINWISQKREMTALVSLVAAGT